MTGCSWIVASWTWRLTWNVQRRTCNVERGMLNVERCTLNVSRCVPSVSFVRRVQSGVVLLRCLETRGASVRGRPPAGRSRRADRGRQGGPRTADGGRRTADGKFRTVGGGPHDGRSSRCFQRIHDSRRDTRSLESLQGLRAANGGVQRLDAIVVLGPHSPSSSCTGTPNCSPVFD